jgi:hypothetical protein
MDAAIEHRHDVQGRPGSMTAVGTLYLFQPSKEPIMNKPLTVVLAALLAGGASLAAAPASASIPTANTQNFASELRTLDRESSPMWIPGVHVNHYAAPADPVPRTATPAQKEAWFHQEYALLQQQSRGAPTVSPPVNVNEPAADPLPVATTHAQKVAANAAEARFLLREATP